MTDVLSEEFWSPLLSHDGFKYYVRRAYQIGGTIEEIDMELE